MEAYRRTRIPGKIDPQAIATVPGSVQVGTAYSGAASGSSVMQWAHTVPYSDNRLILVLIGSNGTITSVTRGGQNFTRFDYTVGTLAQCSIWYQVAPPEGGTTNIIVTSDTAEDYMEGGSVNLTAVSQDIPLASFDGSHGSTGTPSLSVSGVTGDLAVGWIKYWDNVGQATPGAGMTELFVQTSDGSWQTEGARKAGDTSVTLGWTVATTFDAVYAALMVKKV